MANIKDILSDISKKHPDTLFLSDKRSSCVVNEWLSTGVLPLDAITGGGLPVGRVTEIYGDTSTGKSLLAAQVAALAQEDGHVVVYVDTESAVSMPIMEAVGVDTNTLIYATPDTVEEVFDIFDKAIESKSKHSPDSLLLLIWDSIAATSAAAEMRDEYGKPSMAQHARIISQSLRKLARKISKAKVCALFLNQTREKIGVMWGDKVATFGGKAVGFHSSVRIQLKLGKKIKSGSKKVLGMETTALVVKNKVFPPFGSASLPIYFGHGVDNAEATFLYLKELEVIRTSGGWHSIEIDGKDVKFQRKGWYDDVFDPYYEQVADIVLGE